MTILKAKALLFDMDGTLVDSTAAVEGAWATYATRFPHLDVHTILQTSHGVRSIDNIRKYVLPRGTPESVLQAEADQFEIEIVNSANTAKAQGREGIVLLPGSKDIINVAKTAPGNWAICTSATQTYASSALNTVGIKPPAAFVTAGDVKRGKPFPDPYLLGAAECDVDPVDCVVFEDAPSGIRSGKAAGCKVIALLTSHKREAVEAAGPDVIVNDLSHVLASWDGGKFTLRIV